jgi:hypothetical protein
MTDLIKYFPFRTLNFKCKGMEEKGREYKLLYKDIIILLLFKMKLKKITS